MSITETEMRLMAIHKAVSVPLEQVCENYLGMSAATARAKALTHTLPFPTYRPTESQKAPLMVRVRDLADHVDSLHATAQGEWAHSQI